MLDESTNAWLRGLLDRHEAVSGTVHVVRDDLLHIAAAHNIIKEDDSGVVKPGARAVDGKAAVALPVRGAHGTVRAIVGPAWLDERELNEGELAKLDAEARALPAMAALVSQPRQSND
jgi:hypothetical protein